MQQRRLRLGDILDDYCPRERRITNHAVVAMIEDQVKQTRCSTCDADHEYKGARVPSTRKKKAGAPLTAEPSDGVSRPRAPIASSPSSDEHDESDRVEQDPDLDAPVSALDSTNAPDGPEQPDDAAVDDAENIPLEDDGPVHRPLIRATL